MQIGTTNNIHDNEYFVKEQKDRDPSCIATKDTFSTFTEKNKNLFVRRWSIDTKIEDAFPHETLDLHIVPIDELRTRS